MRRTQRARAALEVRQRARDPRNRVREIVAGRIGVAQAMRIKRPRSRAKSHGRPVGKPLRHPTWVSGRENDSRETVCASDATAVTSRGNVRAERAEAGPGRELLADSIGPRPEVGKRKTPASFGSPEKKQSDKAHAVTSRVTSWAVWFY